MSHTTLSSFFNYLISNFELALFSVLKLPVYSLLLGSLLAAAFGYFFLLFTFKRLLKRPLPTRNVQALLGIVFILLFAAILDRRFVSIDEKLAQLVSQRAMSTSRLVAAAPGAATASAAGDSLIDAPAITTALEAKFGTIRFASEPVVRGVEYVSFKLKKPNDAQVFIGVVDLEDPKLEIIITPNYKPFFKFKTSTFARQNDCVFAVNGDAGETHALDSPMGQWGGNWIVKGEPILLEDSAKLPFLVFDRQNKAKIVPAKVVDTKLTEDKYNSIAGRYDLLVNGKVIEWTPRYYTKPDPRTAFGVNKDGSRLYLLVVDGRQRGYSLGLSTLAVTEILQIFGAHDAMLGDGGGASTFYVESRGGVVNVPSDGVNRERPLYTHFGIRLKQKS